MPLTLSEIRTELDTELRRGGTINDDITAALKYAVRVMKQQRFHMQIRRFALIKLFADQTWYANFADEEPSDADQTDGLSEIPHSFDEPWYGGSMSDCLDIQDVNYIDTAGNLYPLIRARLVEFNRIRRSPQTHAIPTRYCFTAENIGFWPTPSTTGYVIVAGHFNPFMPVGDDDTCVFFDALTDLVKAHARWHLNAHPLKDPPAAELADKEVVRLTRLARSAGAAREKTGKIKQHW